MRFFNLAFFATLQPIIAIDENKKAESIDPAFNSSQLMVTS
jgi:hypothetical protein